MQDAQKDPIFPVEIQRKIIEHACLCLDSARTEHRRVFTALSMVSKATADVAVRLRCASIKLSGPSGLRAFGNALSVQLLTTGESFAHAVRSVTYCSSYYTSPEPGDFQVVFQLCANLESFTCDSGDCCTWQGLIAALQLHLRSGAISIKVLGVRSTSESYPTGSQVQEVLVLLGPRLQRLELGGTLTRKPERILASLRLNTLLPRKAPALAGTEGLRSVAFGEKCVITRSLILGIPAVCPNLESYTFHRTAQLHAQESTIEFTSLAALLNTDTLRTLILGPDYGKVFHGDLTPVLVRLINLHTLEVPLEAFPRSLFKNTTVTNLKFLCIRGQDAVRFLFDAPEALRMAATLVEELEAIGCNDAQDFHEHGVEERVLFKHIHMKSYQKAGLASQCRISDTLSLS